ncbi:MAG: hypothetical protein HOJ87_05825 [Rhodospirillaceae bacterium]|nr:hypothetical protein [Rhodospirillaceae bacterium]MBT5561852.1 hypothetical protein [Rhodospirillaceae bacterium]
MAAITNKIADAKRDGLAADYDLSRSDDGIISLAIENWRDRNGSFVIFEIHKVGKKRIIGHRVSWVVQLYFKENKNAQPVKHGCSLAKTQVHAIHAAGLDFMQGFRNGCGFELAYSAAME